MQVEIHTFVSQNNILNAEKKSEHILIKDLPFGAKTARPVTLQYDRILLEFARRHSSGWHRLYLSYIRYNWYTKIK